MKKILKVVFILLGVMVLAVLIDTFQAKILNKEPFIKITEDYNGGALYQKSKGIIVNTYTCTNGDVSTVFKWEKYTCPVIKNDESKTNNDNQKAFSNKKIEEMALNYFLKNSQDVLSKDAYSVGSTEDLTDKYKNQNMLVVEIRHINGSINTLDARYHINIYTAIGFDDIGNKINFNE